MTRFLTFSLLPCLSILSSASGLEKPVKVFVLAGQSNMEGKAPNDLGSAIWFTRIGHAMGEAMEELLSRRIPIAASTALAAEAPKPDAKTRFQYKSEGIEISIPTADEPKVRVFNADTIRAAVKYLDDGALAWCDELPP